MRRALVSLAAVFAASAALACPPAETANQQVAAKSCSKTEKVAKVDAVPACSGAKTAVAKVDSAPAGCASKKAKATKVAAAQCSGAKTTKVAAANCSPADCAAKCASAKTTQVAAKSQCCASKQAKATKVAASSCGSGKATKVAASSCGSGKATKVAASSCGSGKAQATQVAACSSPCSKEAWKAANVPAMLIKVGDKETSCPSEARKISTACDTKPVYVLNGTEYHCGVSAKKAYAKQLDAWLKEATTVKYAVGGDTVSCPKAAEQIAAKSEKAGGCGSVKYQVASFKFGCEKKAEAASVAAKKAACNASSSVVMTVGDTKTCCKYMAAALSEENGLPVVYTVNGEVTECNVEASVMKAMAKIRAALGALESFDATGEPASAAAESDSAAG